jgi:hypothetical protein
VIAHRHIVRYGGKAVLQDGRKVYYRKMVGMVDNMGKGDGIKIT